MTNWHSHYLCAVYSSIIFCLSVFLWWFAFFLKTCAIDISLLKTTYLLTYLKLLVTMWHGGPTSSGVSCSGGLWRPVAGVARSSRSTHHDVGRWCYPVVQVILVAVLHWEQRWSIQINIRRSLVIQSRVAIRCHSNSSSSRTSGSCRSLHTFDPVKLYASLCPSHGR